jgi:two-component system sensor kinase FixL
MKSLRKRLLLRLVPVVMLAIAVTAVASVLIMSRQIHEMLKERISDTVSGVKIEIDSSQEDLLVRANALVEEPPLAEAVQASDRQALLSFLERSRLVLDVDAMTLVETAGRVLARAHAPTRYGDDVSSQQGIVRALRGEHTVGVSRGERGVGVNVVLPIRTNERVLGVLKIEDALGYRFLSRLKEKFGLDAMIFDGDRLQATTFTDPRIIRVVDAELRQRFAQAKEKHGIVEVQAGGMQHFVRGWPLPAGPQAAAAVVIGTSQARIHETIASLKWLYGLVALGLLPLTIWMCIRITSSIVQPIRALSQMTAEVAAGHLAKRVQSTSDDEIGQLTVAFNEMTGKLERTTTSIDSLHKEVEERKHAEREARQRSSEIESVFQALPDLYFRMAADGTILDYRANRRSELYVPPDEFLGRRMQDVLPPDVGHLLAGGMAGVGAGQGLVTFEYQLPLAGVEQEFEARLVPLNGAEVVAVVRNITEQKRTEQTLLRSEAKYRSLIEQIPAVTYTAALDEYASTLFVSPQIEELLGFSPEEWLTDPQLWARQIHPDDAGRVLAEFARAGTSQRPILLEYRISTRDGRTRWFRDTAKVVPDAAGEPIFLHGVLLDITERKHAEERAQRHHADLAHVLRVTTMDELASGLAHELNQPLAAVTNYAGACIEQIRSRRAEPNGLLELLEEIVHETSRAGDIIHHLSDFLRNKDVNRESLNLADLIRNVTSILGPELSALGITPQLDPLSDKLRAYGDAIQIEQVLINLARNALDAIREAHNGRGELWIQTAPVSQDEVEMIEVAVRDNGTGISDAVAATMFEAFFTTKATGLGMGLAISRSIVEAHGGHLWMTRNRGPGVTVRFTVPMHAGGHVEDA